MTKPNTNEQYIVNYLVSSLEGIPKNQMTSTERDLSQKLVDKGFVKWVDLDDSQTVQRIEHRKS